jgi:hypothetical protein
MHNINNYYSYKYIEITSFAPKVCSKCGKDLYWYGQIHDGIVTNTGWHRMDYAQNSYIRDLCDKCCQKHLKNI